MLAAQNIHPLTPSQPAGDARRAAALARSGALDVAGSPAFGFLAQLAAKVCGVSHAWIALVGADTAHILSPVGIPAEVLPREHSYSALAVQAGLWEIDDVRADGRTAFMRNSKTQLRMISAAPLITPDGCIIGALSVADSQPGRLNSEQRTVLQGLAEQVMALIVSHGREQALAAARAQLDELSTVDAQTGVHNRRALLLKLHFEVARTRRFRTPLSALMIGLDRFRDVNQRYGEPAGDVVLANIARLVRDNVRVIDVPGRFGGDQLCVLLPNTPRDGALKLAENLRSKIAALIHRNTGSFGHLAPVTASIGVGAINHMDISEGDALLEQAEQALRLAKANGRNRVEG